MAVISFKHRFVFIKTTKTAGTSIEVELSRLAGDDAVVTPVVPPEEGHLPRNYLGADGTPAFYNHMTAGEIRDRIGAAQFHKMHKFCVEREPVAKCISHFHMRRNSELHSEGGRYRASWAQYCEAGQFPVDTAKYCERGPGGPTCLADTILAYESIAFNLPQLMARLGLPGFRLTARAKSEYSRNKLVDPDQVTKAQRERIYAAFAESLALTGLYHDRAAG